MGRTCLLCIVVLLSTAPVILTFVGAILYGKDADDEKARRKKAGIEDNSGAIAIRMVLWGMAMSSFTYSLILFLHPCILGCCFSSRYKFEKKRCFYMWIGILGAICSLVVIIMLAAQKVFHFGLATAIMVLFGLSLVGQLVVGFLMGCLGSKLDKPLPEEPTQKDAN